MAIDVKIENGEMYAIYSDELGKKSKGNLTPLLVLGKDVDRLLSPILATLQTSRSSTIKNNINKLRALGEGLTYLGVTCLPVSESAWQELTLGIYRFVLTRTDRKASLQIRQEADWGAIRKFFLVLLDEGVIPISVHLPIAVSVLSSIDLSRHNDRLIGQVAPSIVAGDEKFDKLLMSISLARTDSMYLDEVRDTLAFRRGILFKVLTDYWIKLKENMKFGRLLINSVDWTSLKSEIENASRSSLLKNHPASPLISKTGLANYLAVIKYQYRGSPPSDDALKLIGDKSLYLPKAKTLGSIRHWLSGMNAPENLLDQNMWSERSILWWWQGRISHFDVSMLTALLIMLQPSWTPSSVLYAKVINRAGKKYLDFDDNGACFEVKKPRARAMKEENLTTLSYEIISTLIDEGAQLREQLTIDGNPLSSLLFIPYGKNAVTAPIFAAASSYLSGARQNVLKSIWIGSLYPELIENGLGAGTISFNKIRKTEGVLEWFKTKNVKAVSKKLGNSERVVLDHYIPKALLDSWNTRMIRRFQNLWISVAAANENFALEVSDFASIEDLHIFLKDMLQLHDKHSSPLAEALHEKFRFFDTDVSIGTQKHSGHLHIAISNNALAALYSYQSHILELGLSNDQLDKQDAVTGLSPRHFLSIADLLQIRLPLDKNPHFRDCHESAIQLATKIDFSVNWQLYQSNDL